MMPDDNINLTAPDFVEVLGQKEFALLVAAKRVKTLMDEVERLKKELEELKRPDGSAI